VKKTFFSLQCNKTVGESEIMDASSIVEQDRAMVASNQIDNGNRCVQEIQEEEEMRNQTFFYRNRQSKV